jgi:hypothetical protein
MLKAVNLVLTSVTQKDLEFFIPAWAKDADSDTGIPKCKKDFLELEVEPVNKMAMIRAVPLMYLSTLTTHWPLLYC